MTIHDVQSAVEEAFLRRGFLPGALVMNREDVIQIICSGNTRSTSTYRGQSHARTYYEYPELCGVRVFWTPIVGRGELATITDHEAYEVSIADHRDQALSNILNESGKWARTR